MLLAYKENNNLYLVFQDFKYKEEDIIKILNIFPKKCKENILKILKDNFFLNPLIKQKNYINTISTYIDEIFENEEQYFFNLFILPKDVKISYDKNMNEKEIIIKIEELSIRLFKIYSSLNIFKDKRLDLLKNFKGKNFIQLEILFYKQQLENLYNNLINYNSSFKNNIICTDKKVGIEIGFLNEIEENPLKNYQFIKMEYQKDLLVFVYSTLVFLIQNKLNIFRSRQPLEYKKILQIVDKIKNYLLKIGECNNIQVDYITKENILSYFSKYRIKEEILSNIKIYRIIESIFFTQMRNNSIFFISIDLTKVFEKVVEKNLENYKENLYIGDEVSGKIYHIKNKNIYSELNSINNLLYTNINQLKQYPDFLIEDKYDNEVIFHIVDAKYKLENSIINENDIRQVLIYSILFNKRFLNDIGKQLFINKIIIYVLESKIDLNKINELNLNLNKIDLNIPKLIINENLFYSKIKFIGIDLIKQ